MFFGTWSLCSMLCASLSQFLFKKYLNFEKSLGEDNERIQLVQQKAIEYVQSSLPSQDNPWTSWYLIFYLCGTWRRRLISPRTTNFCSLHEDKLRKTEIGKPKDNHIFARYRKTSLGNASHTDDLFDDPLIIIVKRSMSNVGYSKILFETVILIMKH
jgi:hypothetical protein